MWKRRTESADEAVRDLAGELLRVQALRESQSGHPFPADCDWQAEFESAFEFEETKDQALSIEAVRRDMLSPQPMDRLICGDVGFGKTEIAIRAAFRAVAADRQAAVLVPTTVLAEQHERTFKRRFAGYPFRVESLSRFKTAAEQKVVLEELAQQLAVGARDVNGHADPVEHVGAGAEALARVQHVVAARVEQARVERAPVICETFLDLC